MKKFGTFLLLAWLYGSAFATITPLQNASFETHTCNVNLLEVTCDYTARINAIYDGCVFPGWRSGSYTPIYLHNNCEPSYDASDGEFCVQLGHTGEGGNVSTYYDFQSPVIQANKVYSIEFDYLTFNSENPVYYIYLMGSNTLTNNNGPLSTATVNQLKVLGKHAVPTAEPDLVWNTINMVLTNNSENSYSQLLIWGSTDGNLGIAGDEITLKNSRDLDFVFAVDHFGSLIETGEHCCLIPIISFECQAIPEPFRQAPDRPICATIEFLSPCNQEILDTTLFTIQIAPNTLEHPYCETLASQPMEAGIWAEFPNVCFDEEYFEIVIGNEAIYDFTWPGQEFCYECNDLSVSFIFGINDYSCYSGSTTTPGGLYRRYNFLSTSSFGDEIVILYYWTFELADGSIVTSTLANPAFFLSMSRTQCNLGPVNWIPSAIVNATLTIYTENGCKRYATQSLAPFSGDNPDKADNSINTRSVENGNIILLSNMVRNEVVIENQFNSQVQVDITIISSSGVLSQKSTSGTLFPGDQESMDVSHLPAGHYFLVLENDHYQQTYALIKL